MVLRGGSPAIHKLGDIGREIDDYIQIHSETDEYYIGNFVEGYGFIDVKYHKSDCRNLTQDEINKMNKKCYSINGNIIGKYRLDNDGNIIPWTDEELNEKLNRFIIGEIVMIKRSNGEWTEGIVKNIMPFGVYIEVDMPQGKGYKFIIEDKYDTYIKRMKIYINN